MCPSGFVLGPDWLRCEDVDECEEENYGCHQLCINTPGSSAYTNIAFVSRV